MPKITWRKKIKDACVAAGTYQPYFDDVIESLAHILEQRDELDRLYQYDDEFAVVENNRNGRIINPLITGWADLNKQALQFWKELGLTPQSLKKMNDDMLKKKKDAKSGNSLLKLLEEKEKKAN